jgi:hypothetical protein
VGENQGSKPEEPGLFTSQEPKSRDCSEIVMGADIAWQMILVGGIPTHLKNMSSSVGIMTFPTEWKVMKFHGSSHHQAGYILMTLGCQDYIITKNGKYL